MVGLAQRLAFPIVKIKIDPDLHRLHAAIGIALELAVDVAGSLFALVHALLEALSVRETWAAVHGGNNSR